MTTTYKLTPAALSDLEKIADYTLATWGEDQMESYVSALTDRCQWLAHNPNLGRPRNDIHPEYRCYPQERHLVFYMMGRADIIIIGFPHQSMDIEAYFDS